MQNQPGGGGGRVLLPNVDQDLFDELRGRPVNLLPLLGQAALQPLLNGALLVCGFWLDNTAVAADEIQLLDGGTANAPVVARIGVAASAGAWVGPTVDGVLFHSGLSVTETTGTIRGSILARF